MFQKNLGGFHRYKSTCRRVNIEYGINASALLNILYSLYLYSIPRRRDLIGSYSRRLRSGPDRNVGAFFLDNIFPIKGPVLKLTGNS